MAIEDRCREFSGTNYWATHLDFIVFLQHGRPFPPFSQPEDTPNAQGILALEGIADGGIFFARDLSESRQQVDNVRHHDEQESFLATHVAEKTVPAWFPMVGIPERWELYSQHFIETQPNLKGSSAMVGRIVSQLRMCKIIYKNMCWRTQWWSLSFIPFARRNFSSAIQLDRKRGSSTWKDFASSIPSQHDMRNLFRMLGRG